MIVYTWYTQSCTGYLFTPKTLHIFPFEWHFTVNVTRKTSQRKKLKFSATAYLITCVIPTQIISMDSDETLSHTLFRLFATLAVDVFAFHATVYHTSHISFRQICPQRISSRFLSTSSFRSE